IHALRGDTSKFDGRHLSGIDEVGFGAAACPLSTFGAHLESQLSGRRQVYCGRIGVRIKEHVEGTFAGYLHLNQYLVVAEFEGRLRDRLGGLGFSPQGNGNEEQDQTKEQGATKESLEKHMSGFSRSP